MGIHSTFSMGSIHFIAFLLTKFLLLPNFETACMSQYLKHKQGFLKSRGSTDPFDPPPPPWRILVLSALYYKIGEISGCTPIIDSS